MSLLSTRTPEKRKQLFRGGAVFACIALLILGVFASNNWFPRTDAFSGKRYGWFGQELAKNAPSAWNPVAMPSPTATPQLSKEYVYAGSRLLTVEDKNATAVPPADLAVWRPGGTGVWYVRIGAGSWTTQNWGTTGDIPVPGDFDGDGTTDFSVWRPSNYTWYVIHSSSGSIVNTTFGASGDIPASADYDGDGKTDTAVYRPPTGGAIYGVWYIQSTSAGYYTQTWGEAGDIPASSDYDGDGKADIGVFRPDNRTFYSIHSSNGNIVNYASGITGTGYVWETVSSDYDGDGKADYAVFDRTAAIWHIKPSSGTMSTLGSPSSTTSGGFGVFHWGAANDRPVHNDYDTDGKTDVATWRDGNGNWYIRQSSLIGQIGELRQVEWGQTGDTPVPAFYRR